MHDREDSTPWPGPSLLPVSLPFSDRVHAARLLATRLQHLRGRHPLVLAIPRGAVPMGAVLAEALDGELDVVLVHKLGAPFSAELAVGSVDEDGTVHTGPFAREAGADPAYLDREAQRQLAVLRNRRQLYRGGRPPVDAAGRTVVVVDDGLATGETMFAALRAVRRRSPAWLVCAVPVASPPALAEVRRLADEVVCLAMPQWFAGVGQFYADFAQVEDATVASVLAGFSRGSA